MKMRRPSFSQIALLLIAAILAATFFYEVIAAPPSLESVERAAVAPPVAMPTATMASQGGFSVPPAQDFIEIDARPLFSPLRRPPQAVGGNMTAAPPPMTVSLIGIIMGPDQRIAIIRTPSSPKTVNARIGKILDGWELIRIEADHVVLRAGTSEQELGLRTGGQASGGGQTMPMGMGIPR